jgi:BirA family biotin operon repressor/biotin-[acetyl-CoA-carboxylase] ligase
MILNLQNRYVGCRLFRFNELTSTSDEAWSAEPGDAIVADHQTAGRGQHARPWYTRPGTALLLSIVLEPPKELRRPVILTAWATVGVAEAIRQQYGLQTTIKWPNDLLIGGKKVCGILIEQRHRTVVGIGLNLTQSTSDFAAAGIPTATSLALSSVGLIDRDATLRSVLRHLDHLYEQLILGERTGLEAEWRRRLGLIGRPVLVEMTDGGTRTGRLRDLCFDGVEFQAEDGHPEVVKPEVIRHLRPV